jgi:hypothetical protein
MQVGYGVIGENDFHGVDDIYRALFGLRRKQLIATTSSKGRRGMRRLTGYAA